MIEKFNLSDKREDKSNCLKCEREWKCVEGFYNETDVKEFIKLLKKKIKPHNCISEEFDWNISAVDLLKEINELAGEKLI